MTRRLSQLSLMTAAVLISTPMLAQDRHSHHGHEGSSELPEMTQKQIAEVRAAVEKLSTVEAAEAAGYRGAAGITPTMGRHFSNRQLVRDGEIDLLKPEGLMFAPIGDEMKLVGVYYLKPGPKSDAAPEGFHGDADRWHRHDPGERSSFFRTGGPGVSMVHMWTVPAVDGPFTDHNHWLPFQTLGLPYPSSEFSKKHVDVFGKAALGLSETRGIFHVFEEIRNSAEADARAAIEERREMIKKRISPLRKAIEADDEQATLREITAIAADFDALYALYRKELPEERAKIVDIAVGNMLGGHAHHGM